MEHIARTGHIHCSERIWHINGFEFWAIEEHHLHIRHLSCVKARQVEWREAGANCEHIVHICHFWSVEILDAHYLWQIIAIIKPKFGIYRSCIGKWCVEDNFRDARGMVIIPTWVNGSRIFGRYIVHLLGICTLWFAVVILERQRTRLSIEHRVHRLCPCCGGHHHCRHEKERRGEPT